VLATAKIDALGSTQIIVGSAASAFPRMGLAISGAGNPTLAHNSPGSAVVIVTVVPTATAFLIGGDYNGGTNVANIYYNNVTTGGAVFFTEDHPATAGLGIGQMGDNGSPLTGDIGDVLIFNSVLSAGDRGIAMRYLARRSGAAVSNLP